MENEKKVRPKDVIGKYPDGRIDWPTICGCPFCPGVRGIVLASRTIEDKDLAYEVALLQHGYYLHAWEGHNVSNADHYPERCACTCPHPQDKIRHTTPRAYVHLVECLACGARGGGCSDD